MSYLLVLLSLALPALQEYAHFRCIALPTFTAWLILFIGAGAFTDVPFYCKVGLAAALILLFYPNLNLLLGAASVIYLPESHRMSQQSARMLLERNFEISHNFDQLPAAPTIFVCNYVHDRYENIFCMYIPAKITIIASAEMIEYANLSTTIDAIPTNSRGGNYELLEQKIIKVMDSRRSIFCYPQKPCFVEGRNYGKMRGGIFQIARAHGFTITPLYIDPIQSQCGAIFRQTIRMRVGKTAPVINAAQTMLELGKFYKSFN